MRTFKTMLRNELKLSLRGMDMIIFAVCMPIVVLVVIGMIFGDKPAFEGAGYSFFEQSFAAVATISVCAGGAMGLPLVLSEYRSRKILKRFKVTPVSSALVLWVQTAVYAFYSMGSLLLLYIVAVVFFSFEMKGSLLHFMGVFVLVMSSMFSMGIMVGGVAPNTKTASVIASLLYFPMLIFSGATLPYEVMPEALRNAADILPLTQGIKLLKAAVTGTPAENTMLPMAVMIAVTVICTAVSLKFFQWE